VEKKFYKLDEPIYRDKYQVIVYRISESVISEGSLIGLIGLAGSNPELKLELKNYIKSNTKSIHKSIQLYHGSPIQGLKYIEPRECISRIGKNTLVFASDDPRFAACYGAEWRDDTARQGTWDDWNTVVMGISDEVKMNNPCSIYILDNDGSFIQVSNKECVSDHKIKVKKEIKFKTFRDMLNYYEIKVIPYDNYVNSVGKANIDESVITESKTSTYSYTKLSSKDIDDFKEVYKTVFNEAEDPKDDVIKDMKKISKGNKLIGYVGFSYYTIKGKKYLGIGNFMVLPKYQDSGHGTKIIADIINKNKSKYNTIYCYVDKNNKGAIKFYKRIANVNTKNLTKYGYYVTLYNKEEAITEVFRGTQMKSDLDPNFVDKERLDLNDFRKVRINKSFINKYKSTYKTLQHVNSNNNGYAWLDGNKIVAYCFVDNSRELIWITAIEIDKDYKGHGLSKQLLDYAVNELGGEALTVACDNLIAKKVYDDYGFKVSKTSQANVDAHNTAALYMYLDPSKSYLAEAGEIVTEQDIEYYNKYIL
jgi:ribosomal protein S18 acetylase RimI-like enzyme